MANTKISQLSNATTVSETGMFVPVLDTNDTTQAPSGTTKKLDITSILEQSSRETQGYLGLLSAFYFSGSATAYEVEIDEVGDWLDVVMTVHPSGTSDERPTNMTDAKATGYEGDGSEGNPIKFLLDGLTVKSTCTLRASLNFIPDEDGGRLDSRIFLERHSAAIPSNDFGIEAAGLAMESGADEAYPNLVDLQFFVGDTINTNGVDDAGKVRFQVKSDVTGTIEMKEIVLFVQA